MFNSFSDFKGKQGTFEALQQTIATMAKGGFKKEVDENKWQPTADKAGNGSAVIRFLPAPKGEDLPIVKLFSHGFQGPSGKWYIENCPTTINLPCPVCEANSELWNAKGDEETVKAARKIASDRKRKLAFTANILVVKDPKNSDTEGKVLKYQFGTKIMDKIISAQSPSQDRLELGAVPIKVLDPKGLWEGANFILSFKVVNKQRNYDDSAFGQIAPAADSDEALEAIWLQEHPLAEIAASSAFKAYEELTKKRDFVLNAPPSAVREPVAEEPEEDAVAEEPQPKAKKAKTPPKAAAKLEPEEEESSEGVDEAAYYQNLARKPK